MNNAGTTESGAGIVRFSEKQPPALLVRIEIFRYKKISFC
jgi:hypothetical protein